MVPDYLQAVYAFTDQAKAFGHRVLPNGTELVGHVPHRAPEAWLHELFAPLAATEVAAWEQALGGPLPPALRTFYAHHNGLNLFSTALALHGRRHTYERTGDAARQPFDWQDLNRRPPGGAAPDRLFLSRYGDGSVLWLDLHAHTVHRWTTDAGAVQEWPGFEAMLVAETQRLATQFDALGRSLPEAH